MCGVSKYLPAAAVPSIFHINKKKTFIIIAVRDDNDDDG